jgi:hypothetical protein
MWQTRYRSFLWSPCWCFFGMIRIVSMTGQFRSFLWSPGVCFSVWKNNFHDSSINSWYVDVVNMEVLNITRHFKCGEFKIGATALLLYWKGPKEMLHVTWSSNCAHSTRTYLTIKRLFDTHSNIYSGGNIRMQSRYS